MQKKFDHRVSTDRKVFGLSQDGRGKKPGFFRPERAPRPGKKAGFLCHTAHGPEIFRSTEYNHQMEKALNECVSECSISELLFCIFC
ncbi:Uncharacterized protein dnm_097770 [Desulfonema magnum]|uniref:Uncharacterized protein n=1 Tax=Desulfonema magnum TaxID=45655 RepID=A0A975GVX7_9BACT|nr:Uncharacterized protein dnm_097770 [Desulfonema magnum]